MVVVLVLVAAMIYLLLGSLMWELRIVLMRMMVVIEMDMVFSADALNGYGFRRLVASACGAHILEYLGDVLMVSSTVRDLTFSSLPWMISEK